MTCGCLWLGSFDGHRATFQSPSGAPGSGLWFKHGEDDSNLESVETMNVPSFPGSSIISFLFALICSQLSSGSEAMEAACG